MAHFRSQWLGLTLADRRVILLDPQADRYFGLAARSEASVRAQIDSLDAQSSEDTPVITLGSRSFERVEDTRPTISLLDLALPTPTPWSIAWVLAIRARAARQLRRRSLCEVLTVLADRKAALNAGSSMPGDAGWTPHLPLVAAFQASERIVSAHDRCLSLSLALALAVVRRNIPVDLVIGVSGAPFAAHAWVQRGSVLLADQLDRVHRFTPVMVV
jgi:hypothetical protein